ncbi:hypothetical protein O3M35_011285 [Rhynocoris fuscipes]|uniref:Uncharacterized protein n=1 Tax=Rhynocoris fuscipes TaxID=488301 RepID=A0AAW1CVN5_9HEMI
MSRIKIYTKKSQQITYTLRRSADSEQLSLFFITTYSSNRCLQNGAVKEHINTKTNITQKLSIITNNSTTFCLKCIKAVMELVTAVTILI